MLSYFSFLCSLGKNRHPKRFGDGGPRTLLRQVPNRAYHLPNFYPWEREYDGCAGDGVIESFLRGFDFLLLSLVSLYYPYLSTITQVISTNMELKARPFPYFWVLSKHTRLSSPQNGVIPLSKDSPNRDLSLVTGGLDLSFPLSRTVFKGLPQGHYSWSQQSPLVVVDHWFLFLPSKRDTRTVYIRQRCQSMSGFVLSVLTDSHLMMTSSRTPEFYLSFKLLSSYFIQCKERMDLHIRF